MDNNNVGLLENNDVIDRVFKHIDNGTTDLGTAQWREPVEHYTSQSRYEQEIALLRQRPVVFCPSAAIPDAGSFISRTAAGTPLRCSKIGRTVIDMLKNAVNDVVVF